MACVIGLARSAVAKAAPQWAPGKDVIGTKSVNRFEGVVIRRINIVYSEAQARVFWEVPERECRRAVI